MEKDRYDQIIDEVYENYLKTHKNEIFILVNEIDLTKEQFIQTATNNYGFSFVFGLELYEKKLTFEEQVQWVMKNTNVELENLYITEEVYKPTTPTKFVKLMYRGETYEFYK